MVMAAACSSAEPHTHPDIEQQIQEVSNHADNIAWAVSMLGQEQNTTSNSSLAGNVEVVDNSVPLSYLVKQSQAPIAAAFGKWFGGCIRNFDLKITEGHDWTKGHQYWRDATNSYQITFTDFAFDPVLSTWVYGDTQVLHNEVGEVGGAAYLLDNTGNDTPLDFSQDETITLHQERSTETTNEVSLDIGSKTGVTIGGDDFGAKLEQEFSVNLGIKTDETTAESESKDQTTTRHLANTVEPRHATLITISTNNIQSQTPFDVNGIWNSSITFRFNTGGAFFTNDGCAKDLIDTHLLKCEKRSDLETNCHDGSGSWASLTWDSFDSFLDMAAGQNTDWPSCCNRSKYWNTNLIIEGHSGLDKPEDRRIIFSGKQLRKYQDGAEVKVDDVTGSDLDEVIKRHGVDPNNVITESSSGLTGQEAVDPVNIVVSEDAIYVLTETGVSKYDLIGERDYEFNLEFGYS